MLKKKPNTIMGGLLGASLLLSFDAPAHAASLAECDYDEDKISISCRDWSFRLSGRFHLDTLFDATDDSNPQFVQGNTGTAFRRARFGFSGKILKDFAYKSVIDFSDNGVSMKGFYLDYNGIKNVIVRVGHDKPPFGLLPPSSSNNLPFMERVVIPESRYYGANIYYRFGMGQVGFGVHGDTIKGANAAFEETHDTDFGAAARLTFAPIMNDDMYLHVGGSVHYVHNRHGDVAYESRAPFTKAVFHNKTYSVKATDADARIDFSPEIAVGYQSFAMQSEFLLSQVRYNNSSSRDDNTVMGFYLQANYWLTGEHNKFDVKKGIPKGVSPKRDIQSGGYGAFGVGVRWNQMFFSDFDRGTFRAVTVGAIWMPVKNIRVMTEWAQAWRSAQLCGCDSTDEPYGVQMRLQFAF